MLVGCVFSMTLLSHHPALKVSHAPISVECLFSMTLDTDIESTPHPPRVCMSVHRKATTGCGRPSNSDFDILRSSIIRMGKMGGGVPQLYHPDRPVSVPAGHSNELPGTTPGSDSPFDDSQLQNSFH